MQLGYLCVYNNIIVNKNNINIINNNNNNTKDNINNINNNTLNNLNSLNNNNNIKIKKIMTKVNYMEPTAGSSRVWDYVGENYVHRLVMNKVGDVIMLG